MESTSASGVAGVPTPGTTVLRAAAELRFGRPDLTADLARHLMEAAVAGTDRDGWLAAAGWWVHGVTAVGDGREAASEVFEQLPHWGADALSTAAADRLRVELALVAHDAGEDAVARDLLAIPVTDAGPELAADVALTSARCLGADDQPDATLDAAVSAWARVDGPRGEVGAASATVVAAAVARRGGRVERAVGLAVDGLARLDRGRGGGTLTPSGHLAAALAAEWISALVDAGRVEQAREGSVPVRARLVEQPRPTRQLALLRLSIARASASDPGGTGVDPADELERAAQDAAAADVPELEHVCRTALGELYESQGRLDTALESIRLAVVADRRNRARSVRLRAALMAASPLWTSPAAARPAGDTDAVPDAEPRSTNGNGNGSADRTAILRAVRSAQAPPPAVEDRPISAAGKPASARPAPPRPAEDHRPSPRPVRPADPWATGSWTAAPHPASPRPAAPDLGAPDPAAPDPAASKDAAVRPAAPLRQSPAARLVQPVVDPGDDDGAARPSGAPPLDRTVSGEALFAPTGPREPEPDTWLATALAELDRIWGSPTTESAPPTAEADGCVVVLDLARAGERLPPGTVTPTLQQVARRLTDRLPPRSRLRDDGPDALSVVLPGRDRATASEWMHRVLPGLVDGLVVDDAVSGALLRAAVHDADGVVGAQVLQRLDGARGPGEPAARSSRVGQLDDGHRADGEIRADGEGRADRKGRADGEHRAERAAAMEGREPPRHAVPERGRAPAGGPDGPPADGAGRRVVPGAGGAIRDIGRGRADGSGPAPGPSGTPARHDESAGRPPYLPDGVVVRPGSGGRRHRRAPVETVAEPVDAPNQVSQGPASQGSASQGPASQGPASQGPASQSPVSQSSVSQGPTSQSPAPQSTEGLGLADLLAGALAAYRGI